MSSTDETRIDILDENDPHKKRLKPLTISANQTHNGCNSLNLLSPQCSSSSVHDPVHDLVHDLPLILLQQGWRKFWSKREQRPYFFNKITNESLWELPPLPLDGAEVAHFDPITDPLGIQSSLNSTRVIQVPMRIGEKRSSSDDQHNGACKKFILSGPWELEVGTNAVIWEREPTLRPHPHPETEMMRIFYILKLRSQYHEMCYKRQNIEAPRESFIRWFFERKLIDKGTDPVLPSSCVPEISRSMYREIMNDIPIKLVRPKFSAEARKQLSKYAEAARKMIESSNASPENRKVVKWSVDEVMQWIRKTSNATFDDYEDRLKHLRSQCQPHLNEAAKASVEGICSKINNLSSEYAKKVRQGELDLLKAENMSEITEPLKIAKPKRVFCYPLQTVYRPIKLPIIQYLLEKDYVYLKYKNEAIKIKALYLQKLENLYRFYCSEDKKLDSFLARVWCLLKRYQLFFGNPQGEGVFSQASLPRNVFDSLFRNFGVTFECFASPLNCFFRQYCSVFGDTDTYFGSRGSILDFHPISGSFQAFPPCSEQLLEACLEHFERLLSATPDPLSFILFLPEYKETPSDCVLKLDYSLFKRAQVSIPNSSYELRNGLQHIIDSSQTHFRPSVPLSIIFLQNEAGFNKWGPTSQRIDALINSFRMGKDIKDRDQLSLLSPPPTPQASLVNYTESRELNTSVPSEFKEA